MFDIAKVFYWAENTDTFLLLTSWPGIPGRSGAQSHKIFRVATPKD